VKAEGDWQDPDARMGLLAEVARDAERALRAVEEDDELAADAAIAAAAELLREIVGQEFEVQDDELPRPRRGRRTRQIVFGSAATATTHAVIAARDHEAFTASAR
jgi:hypothetical protein